MIAKSKFFLLLLKFFLIISTFLSLPSAVYAEEEKSASIVIKWVDVYGKIQKGPASKKIAWTWSVPKNLENSDHAYETPTLRLWLMNQIPKNLIIEKVTGDGVSFAEPFTPKTSDQMVLDLKSTKGVLRFNFSDSLGKKTEMTLVIEVTLEKPYLLVHPQCKDKNIKINTEKNTAHHLFVGLNCIETEDSLNLYFFRSTGSTWNDEPGLMQFDPENKFTAFKYHAPKPKEANIYTTLLYRAGTKDENGGSTVYGIYYVPKVSPNRFYSSAGIGVSYYMYKEKIDDLSMTQMSITGKANIGYRLIPRVLDVAMNIFGNMYTLYSSPTPGILSNGVPVSNAQFYGVNGRLGYRLPVSLGASEFMFLAGWYLWGMFTPQYANNKVFGVDRLSGPQLFLSFVNAQAGHRRIFAYFKFAFISESLSTFGSGMEFAAGGGFDLFPKEVKSWSLTLDLANATYSNEFNGLSLLSATLGVQKPF